MSPQIPARAPGAQSRFGVPRRSQTDSEVSVYLQRFMFRSAATREPASGTGIVSATGFKPGQPALVLMVDLQSLNSGASLTNSAEAAVHHVAHMAFEPLGADYRSASWVQLDSDGAFDLMVPRWPMDKPLHGPQLSHPSVDWRPVRHNGRTRTLDAFLSSFPGLGPVLWDEVATILKSLGAGSSQASLPKD